MTDNENINSAIQNPTDSIKPKPSVVNPGLLIGTILTLRATTDRAPGFLDRFLEFLTRQPGLCQAALYSIDAKSRDLNLAQIYSISPEKKESTGITIPARSTETLARVAFNAQPTLIPDLGEEIANYQDGVLDPEAKSIFIAPILKSNQVIYLLDLQFDRSFGISREDVPGMAFVVQLFGEFLEEKSLQEVSGLSFSDLIVYTRTSNGLISESKSESLNKIFLSAFENSDFVSFIFKVGEDDLTLEDLFDAKGTGFDSSLIGLKIETKEFKEIINSREPQFYADLSANIKLGDLFSFFIRRECKSLSLLPVFLGDEIIKIVIIGSREKNPIDFNTVKVYQKLIEIYQDRLAFDFRALQTTRLEKDFESLIDTSTLVLVSGDQQEFFSSLLGKLRSNYFDQLNLSFAEVDTQNNQIRFTRFAGEESVAALKQPFTPEDFANLETITGPLLLRDASQAVLDFFNTFSIQPETVIIPIDLSVEKKGVLFFENPLGDKSLSSISHDALLMLGKMVVTYFHLQNLRSALSKLDETVSRTVNRQQILNQISIQSGSSRNPVEILSAIPKQFVDSYFCDEACVLVPASQGNFEVRYYQSFSDQIRGQKFKIGERLAGKAAATNQSVMSSSTQEEQKAELFISSNLSGLAAPISFGDEIFAILEMEHAKADQYNSYDLELIQIFCSSIGSLLANLKLVDQVKAQIDRQEKLFDVTNKLRRSLDMNTILQISATEIARITNARKASIQISIAQEPEPDADLEPAGGEE